MNSYPGYSSQKHFQSIPIIIEQIWMIDISNFPDSQNHQYIPPQKHMLIISIGMINIGIMGHVGDMSGPKTPGAPGC